MRASYTAICATLLLLFATETQLSVMAVTCNPAELSPCLSALTGPSEPTKLCCTKLKVQEPCLCEYLKNPDFRKYLDTGNADKVSKACGVPFPTC